MGTYRLPGCQVPARVSSPGLPACPVAFRGVRNVAMPQGEVNAGRSCSWAFRHIDFRGTSPYIISCSIGSDVTDTGQ